MKKVILGGRVWSATHEWLENTAVWFEDGKVIAVGDGLDLCEADEVIDASGLYVLPGLVDVHTHGRIGFDFSSATADQMRAMKLDYAKRGVTSVFATLASGTDEEWENAIARIEESDYEGVHFEGCWLNSAKKGAHAAHLLKELRAEDVDRFLKLSHLPCHVSAALELDVDGSFSKAVLEHGATLGLGHTCATAAQARLAVSRGATSFTHLFNAMPALHHREGGAVAVALLGGGFGELIADGIHVCPDMIALAYRCLGKDKTVLITDSMAGTGCSDGDYSIAGMPVIVKNGKAILADGTLAGSTLNLWDGVRNLMQFADIPLEDAVACATVNPARMVKIDGEVGGIEAGKRADILLVDADLRITRVFCKGEDPNEGELLV